MGEMSRLWLKEELYKDESLPIHTKILSKYLMQICKIVLYLIMGLCLREVLMNAQLPILQNNNNT